MKSVSLRPDFPNRAAIPGLPHDPTSGLTPPVKGKSHEYTCPSLSR
jgi:hypothetical protein